MFYHKTFLDNTPRYNKRLGEYINYRGIRDLLLAEFPELKVAYELREFYLELNSNCNRAEAPYKIDKAISLFADSGISELIAHTTTNVIGMTTVIVRYPNYRSNILNG